MEKFAIVSCEGFMGYEPTIKMVNGERKVFLHTQSPLTLDLIGKVNNPNGGFHLYQKETHEELPKWVAETVYQIEVGATKECAEIYFNDMSETVHWDDLIHDLDYCSHAI